MSNFFNQVSNLDYDFAILKKNVKEIFYKAIGSLDVKSLSDPIKVNPLDGKSTEFYEFIEALEEYKNDPTFDNEVELLLEIGDVLSQKELLPKERYVLYQGSRVDFYYEFLDEVWGMNPDISWLFRPVDDLPLFCIDIFDRIIKQMSKIYPFDFKEAEALNINKVTLRESLGYKNKKLEHETSKLILMELRNGKL